MTAEINAQIKYSGCLFGFCPDAIAFKPAAVGLEGGVGVQFESPELEAKIQPFVTAYVRAELEINETRKLQLFNVSKTWKRETVGGSLKAALYELGGGN